MGTSVDAFVGRFVGAFVGVLEGLKTGKSILVGHVVGALVGDLVGALVGRGSLSPALSVAHLGFRWWEKFSEMLKKELTTRCLGGGSTWLSTSFIANIGSAKTDPVWFKSGFGEGLLKDKLAFFEASKNPIPERRKLLAKRPFL